MPLETTSDLLYLVSAIAIPIVAIFLCWALYEIACVFRQTNQVMADAREKISSIERALSSMKERVECFTGYLAVLAEGGKSLMSLFHRQEEKKELRRKSKRKNEEEE
jgi:hypothetical protein